MGTRGRARHCPAGERVMEVPCPPAGAGDRGPVPVPRLPRPRRPPPSAPLAPGLAPESAGLLWSTSCP